MLYWYRSSQKKKRDARDRDERLERTIERLKSLDVRRMRGPKTDAAIGKRVAEIIAQHHAEERITVEVKWDAVEKFKAITRGKPTAETAHALQSSQSVLFLLHQLLCQGPAFR
jgi:hypothetical protein